MHVRNAFRTVIALASGALAMFLFDPDRGRARRARLSSQGAAKCRRLFRRGRSAIRYERSKLAGHRSARAHQPAPPEDDSVVVQKVRSEVLGRAPYRHLNVIVDCFGGTVHLRGAIPDSGLAEQLVDAVSAVDGVVRVESFLHAPDQPAPNKAAVLAQT